MRISSMKSLIKLVPFTVLLLCCSDFHPSRSAASALVPSASIQIAQTANSSTPAPRRPRRRLGGRGESGLCVVAPGLLEQENVIWSDRPLFLWKISSEAVAMQRLEVIDQDGRILWDKRLAAADQSAEYEGQALQPSQYYQWRLVWTMQGTQNSATYTFQVMDTDRRDQITTQLQALNRQLQAAGASAEAIANQQADALLNQPESLWSDAIQTLYTVRMPSSTTVQTIQTWVNTACGESPSSN
ncbi:hypothetical protein IFO70_22865 [Phormidium tenue FACHB-886]|nr:hypothetical protein [Phormidium tenue FACHB-886]